MTAQEQHRSLGIRGVILTILPRWGDVVSACCPIPEESVIEDMLRELPGIEEVVVLPEAAQYTVYYQPNEIEVDAILRSLRFDGYDSHILYMFRIVG